MTRAEEIYSSGKIFDRSNTIGKIILHTNKSDKANAYINMPIGVSITNAYKLENKELNITNRCKLAKDIIPAINDKNETNIQCKRCPSLLEVS